MATCIVSEKNWEDKGISHTEAIKNQAHIPIELLPEGINQSISQLSAEISIKICKSYYKHSQLTKVKAVLSLYLIDTARCCESVVKVL